MSKISRRNFNKTVTGGVGAAALTAATVKTASAKMKKKPNIVFICSAQHSFKYTGYMGHSVVKTPNLDRIAKEGVTFTNAYSCHPVCTPGRAAMMTGYYASDVGSYCNSTVWDGSKPIWGTHLQEKGYYTRAIGKMDLNDDFDHGFEEFETSHGHRHRPDITSLFRRPVGYRVNERLNVNGRSRENPHKDTERAQMAVHYLQQQAKQKKQPWALYVGMTAPHPSFVALKKYWDMYPSYSIDMPNIPPGHLEDLHLAFQEIRRFKRVATPITDEKIRKARAGYYGLISELDANVGMVYDELKKSGELENTLFIYTSDHGESLGEHGLWFKNNLYDVAARIPLLMAGAGLPKNKRVDTPVSHVDMVATILDVVKHDARKNMRGASLLPLIDGKKGDHPGYAFSEVHSEGNCTGSFMIRKGDWKLIHFTWYDDVLFNVKNDPGEFNNLIDDPESLEIKEDLNSILNSQLGPEKVTVAAFKAQDEFLANLVAENTEDELFEMFKGRLGKGLARAMAAKAMGR
jgi:choline-sulfatase